MKTIKINNITIKTGYRIIEFYKNNIPYYRLSKHENTSQYSILNYKTGILTFFVPNWNKQKLIKQYVNLLTNL